MPNITIDQLANAIKTELEAYSEDVAEQVKTDVKTVAQECKDEIKANSPVRTGGYRKSWKTTVNFENKRNIRITVHNGKYYRLTHLLENGHAKLNGGRVEGKPHIAPAEKNAESKLMNKVKVAVKQ